MEQLEKQLHDMLGEKIDGHYMLEDGISVDLEKDKRHGLYSLWIEDRRYKTAFAWNWDIERNENGYTFTTTHDYNLKCDSLEKVFRVVKMRPNRD